MSDILQTLQTRRSTKLTAMAEPGPSYEQIETILKIASRVPDHGKYAPWYFIVLEGNARAQAGQLLREAYAVENPDTPEANWTLRANASCAPLLLSRLSPASRMAKIRNGNRFYLLVRLARIYALPPTPWALARTG